MASASKIAAFAQVLAKLIGQEGRTVVDRLVARAAAFGRGRPLRDDINLVAVSRQGHET